MVTRDLQPDIRRTEFPPCNKTISPPIMKSIIFSWWLFLAALVAASISPFDSPDFCLQIITPTCNTTFSYIDEVNDRIRPLVLKLVTSPFFRFFKLNLDKQCKFWNAQHFCATRNCAVDILPTEQYNWSNVPTELLPSKLGEIHRGSKASDGSETCEDLDYCHIDDDHHCVFVDLPSNPERFTGYGGAQSFEVWKAIYSENCFPNTAPMTFAEGAEQDQCVEKNLFYRVISGLHASVAVHLSNEYLNPVTEQFEPNLKIFMERVGKFNDRLSNIYFNYALISQAIVKLGELAAVPEFIEMNTESKAGVELLENTHTTSAEYAEMLDTISLELSSEKLFDTHLLFDPKTVEPGLKEEFRSRFRNVSAIMDCVGCDRCRMWGKLQTIGYGTALKVLFELEDPTTQHLLKFRRIELVALFNTFDRLSKSISSINNFKKMYLKHLEEVAAGEAKHGDYEPIHGKGIEFPFVSFLPRVPSAKDTEAPVSEEVKQEAFKSQQDALSRGGRIYSQMNPQQGFWEEVDNIKAAVYFVLRSYVDFPKRVYDLGLYYINGWWNVYIGKAIYVPQSSGHDEL
ncbi:hypothetical protein PUMCH_004380 [Australozyma saopauloensis]|uniref:Endoplasmic oxidoreductin-1 n=1 Tax=Australozyma saopauloensis TaxID=291208 RepID=A0AAX4HF11_9ASCO|nr:hypothetical protein PUMCH_004380 [[Candida] saopauloensis]